MKQSLGLFFVIAVGNGISTLTTASPGTLTCTIHHKVMNVFLYYDDFHLKF